MSVREYRLIVIDDKRVLVVDDRGSNELHGNRLRQALAFLGEPTRLIDPSSRRASPTKTVPAVMEAVPAPETPKRVMPQGITRNATTRDHYLEYKHHPLLAGAPYKVLQAVATFDRPVTYRDMVDLLTSAALAEPMRIGTVGSALFYLSSQGFLLKSQAPHVFQYTLTEKGEDALTRLEPAQEKLL